MPVLIGGLVQGIDLPCGAAAETCLSPYVKRLDRPEKYLYLFCVDADARDNDFVTVIDVNPDSLTYGTILNTVDLGSKGNETHHWGYTDDRTKIWAGGLFSNRIWILDVATDPGEATDREGDRQRHRRRAACPARTATTRCRAGC